MQRAVPILCVDILLVQVAGDGELRVGLIERRTPFGRSMRCQVGGRVGHGETLREAHVRHLGTTGRARGSGPPRQD